MDYVMSKNKTVAHLPNYFRHPDYVPWIYAHAILIVIAWAIVLPVAIMISIAKSKHRIPMQALFHIFNGLAMFTGFVYNHATPDLYAHNKHTAIGWVATMFTAVWTLITVAISLRSCTIGSTFRSLGLLRYSWQFQKRKTMLYSELVGSDSDTEIGSDENVGQCEDEHKSFQEPPKTNCRVVALSRIMNITAFIQMFLERTLLLTGFVAIVSGFVVYSGDFRGSEVLGGLSHWIKGGLFFWFGLLSLGRWLGAFAKVGWAWNIRRRPSRVPSAEFIESFVICGYWWSNIFLEHLSAWGKGWTAVDFEHISITLLFFGGGLFGMLVESKRIRDIIDTNLVSSEPSDDEIEEDITFSRQPKTSLNPIPSLTLMLLGLTMSSHQRETEMGTRLHAQLGWLFCGAALARTTTYVMLCHKPPTGHLPARPLTELITAFTLTGGGILFMMSGRDSIAGLMAHDIHAMTAFTAVMGLSALLLGWEMVVLLIKAISERHERGRQSTGIH